MGNIIASARGYVTTTYAYDGLGQLTRVNDPAENATWVYNYDRGGNILSKVKYAYTTGTLGTALQTISYTYGDANWKDKLTAYNGVGISYDAIGNPLSDGTWTYVWQNGRQLASMAKSGTSASFVYNADGLRIQKTVNGAVTNYILHGKNIVHLSRGSDDMHFWYDAQNRPAIIEFNSTKYAYIHNLQGDVVGLRDAAGNEVVRYTYDAWGKMLSTAGSLASTLGYMNPFRYRGYVYDEETGLYYLRSRYYNPNSGRFVNADSIISKNQYPYCNNSPIAMNDDDGNVPSYCTKMTDSGGGNVKKAKEKTTVKKETNKNTSVRPFPIFNKYGLPDSVFDESKLVKYYFNPVPGYTLSDVNRAIVDAFIGRRFKEGYSYGSEPRGINDDPKYNVSAYVRYQDSYKKKGVTVYLKLDSVKHYTASYKAQAYSFAIGSQSSWGVAMTAIGDLLGLGQFTGQPDYYTTTEVVDCYYVYDD